MRFFMKCNQYSIEKEKNRFLDTITILRFPLIILVLCIHSKTIVYYNAPDTTATLEVFFSEYLSLGAVPTFFFISGYLFFRNGFSLELYKRKLKSRVKSLLIPYILWSLIAFAILSIKYLPVFASYFENLHKNPYDLNLFLMSFVDRPVPDGFTTNHTPLLYPLWYVRDLILLVILSPLIYYVRSIKIWIIALLCFICGYVYVVGCEFQFYSVLFFVAGSYYTPPSIHYKSKSFEVFLLVLLSVLFLIMFVIAEYFFEGIKANFVKFVMMMYLVPFNIFVAEFLVLRGYCISKFLTDSTFFVFCFHALVCGEFSSILGKILHVSERLSVFCFFLILLFVTLFFSLFVFALMRKFCPKTLAILSGGRY